MTMELPRVLVVDDEPSLCELIREDLSLSGFSCTTTTDSRQAKELLKEQEFQVLIADILMPHVSGLDLLAHVRGLGRACRVVLITGGANREQLAQAFLLGAYDYIEKPFPPGELVEVVSKAAHGDSGRPSLFDRAAAAMELSSQARHASLDSVRALVRAVEAKDPYTRRHSEQVAHYATHLAAALGLPEPARESIRIASLLHDIGKIGVPDHILTKPGSLTAEEFQCVRRHPALGGDILASISLFGAEARLVRFHHERWDGKGYPDGLTGEETPLGSRVIQVADCIDAMLMERTYKKGYPAEKMLGELGRCAGTQFDPRLAAAAVQWCRGHPDKMILPNQTLTAAAPAA